MNVTKRRHLSTDSENPTSGSEELIRLCETIADCETQSAADYCRKIEWVNYAICRFDRGFIAGYITAARRQRASRP